ncbi:MFS monosaccharide transporter [Gymnopus androsaceus JB14]|uniref:MFS monosaccharide transporter n=1 Tax=Gymnopus androsaceus JB14 TaxID=1447944 RepID=A0A6A4HLE2_9AGAR|nr:MFS monosaccharide transporter [Gymnopus androsaceus JB14]
MAVVGSLSNDGSSVPKNKFAAIAITTFAAFGGILYGYDTGIISGIVAMDDWLKTFGYATGDPTKPYAITTSTDSLVVSILSAGTFFGALASAPLSDFLGRRWSLVVACLLFSIGVAMQTASTAIPLFATGRVFAGLGVGITSTVVPMYQSECAPKWIRGAVVALYQWAITIGLLLAAVVNNATKDRPNHSAYRIPIAIQLVWAFVLSTGMIILPESPRWLMKKGKETAAAKALSRLMSLPASDPEVESELAEIKVSLDNERALGNTSYLDCFRSGHNKLALRTWTGMAIQGWQQLTGINFIFYYGTTFFTASGINNPFLITVAVNVVNMGATIPGVWGIERFGRRRLLLVGAIGMAICEFIVAIVGVTVSTNDLAGQHVLIAFVCIYIAFFASTWGPIAYVIIGEIFPLETRAKQMSLSTASNWLFNWAIAYATPYLVNVGPGEAGLQVKVFFVWGSTCACCVLFTYFFIPETKGLSLEQVDDMYQNTYPLTAGPYRQRLIAENIHITDAQKGAGKDVADSKEHEHEEVKVAV